MKEKSFSHLCLAFFVGAFLFASESYAQMPSDTSQWKAYVKWVNKANRDSFLYPAYKDKGRQRADDVLRALRPYSQEKPKLYTDALAIKAQWELNMGESLRKIAPYFDTLVIFCEKYKREDTLHAMALYGKALMHRERGEKGELDSLIKVSLKMMRTLRDTMSSDYSKVYSLYGISLFNTYRRAETLKIFQESAEIARQAKDFRQYANMLSSVGEAISQQGRRQQAIDTFLKARKIFKKIHEENTAIPLDKRYYAVGVNLAKAYSIKDSLSIYIAIDLCREDLAENKDTFSLIYTAMLNNLAACYFGLKRYKEARPHYERSIMLLKKMGHLPTHPRMLRQRSKVFQLDFAEGRWKEALAFLSDQLPEYWKEMLREVEYFSEDEMANALQGYWVRSHLAHSFAFRKNSPEIAKLLYNNVLVTKTALFDNNLRIRKAIQKKSSDAEVQTRWKKWIELNRNLNQKAAQDETTQRYLDSLEVIREKEREMFFSVGYQKREDVTWEDIKSVLKKDKEVAVEFIHFNYLNPWKRDSIIYAALIMRPEYEAPVFVPLFEKRQLDIMLKSVADTTYVSSQYTRLYQAKVDGQSLSAMIWTNKLSNYIRRGETVYYATDGELSAINPAAIFDLKNDYTLVDFCNWFDVGSTRELALARRRPSECPTYPQSGDYIKAYGGIDYGVTPPLKRTDKQSDSGCRLLPKTGEVVSVLDSLCGKKSIDCLPLYGPSATEASLFDLNSAGRSPWLLHIGTHGFSYDRIDKKQKKDSISYPYFIESPNPMRRCGLKLYNACQNWNQPKLNNLEDGILFAQEAALLNLPDTYLTVLSACESGFSQNRSLEGHFGLRRAFRIAGSRYMLLNLWEVKDETSLAFYKIFYNNLLVKRMAIKNAFLETQKHMRANGFREPYHWASFVLVGPH